VATATTIKVAAAIHITTVKPASIAIYDIGQQSRPVVKLASLLLL
jgi:hypothetical protein